ncbi:uncharacterized protein TNCV_935411 [Trichonephila clavipes]|nr:uncharacterized protein TNCV_935411 [Trichonephila clavipes]
MYETKTFMFTVVGSQFLGGGGESGMIHRDAHHLGIAAITEDLGKGELDGHWLDLVVKHFGMRKIGGLTRHVAERGFCALIYVRGA